MSYTVTQLHTLVTNLLPSRLASCICDHARIQHIRICSCMHAASPLEQTQTYIAHHTSASNTTNICTKCSTYTDNLHRLHMFLRFPRERIEERHITTSNHIQPKQPTIHPSNHHTIHDLRASRGALDIYMCEVFVNVSECVCVCVSV